LKEEDSEDEDLTEESASEISGGFSESDEAFIDDSNLSNNPVGLPGICFP
jgi:hypothetical protein